MQHHTYDYAQWKFDRARHIITQPIWGSRRGLALSAPRLVGSRAQEIYYRQNRRLKHWRAVRLILCRESAPNGDLRCYLSRFPAADVRKCDAL